MVFVFQEPGLAHNLMQQKCLLPSALFAYQAPSSQSQFEKLLNQADEVVGRMRQPRFAPNYSGANAFKAPFSNYLSQEPLN